jgi:hypothetical protein
MRDRPDGSTLAEFARQATAREADSELVADALAIAEREAVAGQAPLEECRAALLQRYGEGDVEALLHRFADDIRAGVFDVPGPPRDAALQLLWAMTRQKLRESNPEYLAAATGSAHPSHLARPRSV